MFKQIKKHMNNQRSNKSSVAFKKPMKGA